MEEKKTSVNSTISIETNTKSFLFILFQLLLYEKHRSTDVSSKIIKNSQFFFYTDTQKKKKNYIKKEKYN